MNIRVYNTHIEIEPYKLGNCVELERLCSVYDKASHKYIPKCFFIDNDILYVPKGISVLLLEKFFNVLPINYSKADDYEEISEGDGIYQPKNRIQENAIKFLMGVDEYYYTNRNPQLGLNLNTGDGKTYCSIYSILKLKKRAIIITHLEKLKDQWIDTVKNMTNFPDNKICNIDSSEMIEKIFKDEIDADLYFVNHQTITSYARNNGWLSIRDLFKKIKVAIKVIDESHKFFENTFMIDCFSNCLKTYYLTATFGRSDPDEIRVYKRTFASLLRFGEETIDYVEKRRHTKFIVCFFKSTPTEDNLPTVQNTYGFNSYKYIDYELNEVNNTLIKVVFNILENVLKLDGKILITSPKKSSVDLIAKSVYEKFGIEVGTIYSKNNDEENKRNKDKRIISSTIKSVGEGSDIKGLRVLINLEPVSSKLLIDQVQGRLREYGEKEDTYLFYPVDKSIIETYNSLKKFIPVMKRKCKEIIYTNIEV